MPRLKKPEEDAQERAISQEKKEPEPTIIPRELCPREIRYLSRKHPVALAVYGFIEDAGVRIDRVELM